MAHPVHGKYIALGVAGSVACYKAVDLASKLTQSGALVDVLMTGAATKFLSPLLFQSITHRPVTSDLFDPRSEMAMDHVAVAQRAAVVVIAPATANLIAKIAHGLADDAVTSTLLATTAPVIVAPAMDANMFDSPATQENVAKLESRGFTIAGPAEGRLASGLLGKGRLLDTQDLLGYVRWVLGRGGDLDGRKIVVSAGGTQEPIDPVRHITNRSSGKMGYAIAEGARDRGATAVLVTAPTSLPDPIGVRVVRVESALQMMDAVATESADAHALIMAAAVADWRPAASQEQKIKKGPSDGWSLELVKNPDILAKVRGNGLIRVGFAAESENIVANARTKLEDKDLDLMVANDVSRGDVFGADTNSVVLLDREGGAEELPELSKYDVGGHILDSVAKLVG